MREGIEESPWESLIGGLVLGGDELLEVVRQKTQGASAKQSGTREIQPRFQIDQIVAAVSKVKGEAWEMYRNRRGDWGRAMVLMVGRRKAGIANGTLAEWLGGMDDSAVTQAVKRLQAKMETDRKLMKIYRRVEEKMSNVKM